MTVRWAMLAAWAILAGVGSSHAQETQEPPTRVGFFNLAAVLQRSEMMTEMRKDIEKVGATFKKDAERQRDLVVKLRKDLADPALPADQREPIEKKFKTTVRKLEDLEQEARTVLTKKSEHQVVEIYKTLHATVKAYAEDHGFGAIMAYGDVIEEKDLLSPAAVNRRLNGVNVGALSPFYIHPRNDVTNLILDALNLRYRELKDTSSK